MTEPLCSGRNESQMDFETLSQSRVKRQEELVESNNFSVIM